jgi:hypothetical protein
METLIGFAFGYWVGTRQGREGLQRALDVTGVLKKAAGQRGAEIRDLLDEFVERRYGRQPSVAA